MASHWYASVMDKWRQRDETRRNEMILHYVSLGVIVFSVISATAGLVVLGSLPGRIARKRNHPWPEAVNVASWIGLATAVLWPLALIWAFLPVPYPREQPTGEGLGSNDDSAALQQRIAELEASVAQMQSKEAGA